MGQQIRISDILTMKDILDYNETIILPRFKERFGNILIGLIQLTVLIAFLYSTPGQLSIDCTYRVLTSSFIHLQILAAILLFVFGGFFIGMLMYFLWQLFGREKITKTTSALIVERFCILKFETRIELSDIYRSQYFHVNVRNNFLRSSGKFPFHFGKMRIMTKDKKVYCFGYDLSMDEFSELQ